MKLAIAKYRKRKGWTQAQLAAKAGMTRAMVAQYETGASGAPFTAILVRIAQALDIDVGDLFEEGEETPTVLQKGRPPKQLQEQEELQV
jgi:transcriptional regulator with XRE-family HTH domain